MSAERSATRDRGGSLFPQELPRHDYRRGSHDPSPSEDFREARRDRDFPAATKKGGRSGSSRSRRRGNRASRRCSPPRSRSRNKTRRGSGKGQRREEGKVNTDHEIHGLPSSGKNPHA